jgi:SAM-dependent methyltransferase
LVIGCGRGAELKVLGELTGAPPIGVDINPAFINEARSLGFEAHCADLDEGLPFDDDAFDLAYGFAILEHVESPARVLRELYRVLVPGGMLLVRVPNIHYQIENLYYKGIHLNYFTKRALRYTLMSHGFSPQHIFYGPLVPRYVYFPGESGPGGFKAVRRWLFRHILRSGSDTLPFGMWKVLGNLMRAWAPCIYAVAVKDQRLMERRYAPWQEALSEGEGV